MVAVLAIAMNDMAAQESEEKTLLQTEIMAERLGLDGKQKAELDRHLKAAKADREAMRKKLEAFKEEMLRDAYLARKEREKRLQEILTDEQWAAYKELRDRARQRSKGALKSRRPGGPGMRPTGSFGRHRFGNRGGLNGQGKRYMIRRGMRMHGSDSTDQQQKGKDGN